MPRGAVEDNVSLQALGGLDAPQVTHPIRNAVAVRKSRLQLATGNERFELLLEIGDVMFGKLNDRAAASKAYTEALEERPDDRKLLAKLMQLYSEEKDWAKLVDVVLRLADFVEDPRQRAKYMHTAATIASKHLDDIEKALGFYKRALEFDPSNDKALNEAVSDAAGIWVNRPPVAVIDSPTDGAHYLVGEAVTLQADSSWDVDGDGLVFEWYLDGLSSPAATGDRTGLELEKGVYNISLLVKDDMGAWDKVCVKVYVDPLPPPQRRQDTGWQVFVVLIILLIVASILVVVFYGRRAVSGSDRPR